jgi:hypothetical protein
MLCFVKMGRPGILKYTCSGKNISGITKSRAAALAEGHRYVPHRAMGIHRKNARMLNRLPWE